MQKLYKNRRARKMTCQILGNDNGDRIRFIHTGDTFWIDDEATLPPQVNQTTRVLGYYIQNELPIQATFSKYQVQNQCDLIKEA
tara:strand:- start:736 stop:987 length:252 start_codon:yes stop_codon:yes gene_type:complete